MPYQASTRPTREAAPYSHQTLVWIRSQVNTPMAGPIAKPRVNTAWEVPRYWLLSAAGPAFAGYADMVGPAVISASVQTRVPAMKMSRPPGTEYRARPQPSRANPASATTRAGQR